VLVLLVAAGAALAAKPTKVVIITMDQMKPWYAQAYDMENILWLEDHGAYFKRATVGQMASETVVSHNTIVSGQLPKHMGWSDEVMRDADGVLYDKGDIVTVGDLTYEQYAALIDAKGYPKLGDYMHAAFPGTVVANFGGKYYQVASTAASSSDIWVTYGSKKDVDAAWGLPWTGKYRGPSGGNVPSYIANDNRFKISTGNHAAAGNDYYGTDVDQPAYLYPEDGRMVPGPYDTNLGGDDWVADCAIKVIENEDWSALHLNFSGIDKIGHMWGGGAVDTIANYGWDPDSLMKQVHMPWIARNADDQVGRVIQALKKSGDWAGTLFVVLADHGATWAENAHYVDTAGGGNYSWYYDPNDTCANTDYGTGIAPDLNNDAVLAPLNATGNLAYSYQSTAIEAWLIDYSWAKKMEEAQAMRGMPDVIATYVKWGDRYKLVSTGSMTASERKWWAAHGQELVDTMASDASADVVGLLKDHTSYGVYGDHGGAQREVQRVPMVFYAEGMTPIKSGAPFHLVDVLPTVLRNMGIKQMAPMDGKAYNLPLH
jgi:arylsulfatase A-like enzyme